MTANMMDKDPDNLPPLEDRPGEDVEAEALLADAAEQAADLNDESMRDLSLDDLAHEGVDPLDLQTTAGIVESDHGIDDASDETIDQRVLQEEYEPGSAIVPPPRGAEDRIDEIVGE